MGVVYYANYLTWFEVGRSDLLRQLGKSYREIEKQRVYLPVLEAHCRYLKPARYDDLIRVKTRVSRASRASVKFEYEVERPDDDALLASGMTVHVAVDEEGRPRRLPAELVDLLHAAGDTSEERNPGRTVEAE